MTDVAPIPTPADRARGVVLWAAVCVAVMCLAVLLALAVSFRTASAADASAASMSETIHLLRAENGALRTQLDANNAQVVCRGRLAAAESAWRTRRETLFYDAILDRQVGGGPTTQERVIEFTATTGQLDEATKNRIDDVCTRDPNFQPPLPPEG